MQRFILSVIVLIMLVVANFLRYDTEATKSAGNYVIHWVKDTWTNETWIRTYSTHGVTAEVSSGLSNLALEKQNQYTRYWYYATTIVSIWLIIELKLYLNKHKTKREG